MLIYDCAFDHYKYFKWGTIYAIDMTQLPSTHPELYQHFLNGYHTVSRSKDLSKFNSVSTDMALEQSLNKDTKTKGGIIGFTQDYDAVERWTLTSHLRAAVYGNFKDLAAISQSSEEKELSQAKIKKSEKSVVSVIKTVKEQFVSPFEFNSSKIQYLQNIVSGVLVKDEFREEILNAHSIGKQAADEFVKERILDGKTSFWAPITKMNLKTFSSGDKVVKVNRKNQSIATIKSHQNLFSKLLTVSSSRNIDLKSILTYELSAVPLSLFYTTGEMRKVAKSKLLHEIEMKESSENCLPQRQDSVTIIDFMAVVQTSISSKPVTFQDLLKYFENCISTAFKESTKVVLVPDRYDIQLSIKANERLRRAGSVGPEIKIHSESQRLPKDFHCYLSNSKNKVNLINYAFQIWVETYHTKLRNNQCLILTHLDGSTTQITSQAATPLNWSTDHEEADSKMFVFCKYMMNTHQIQRIIIASPDTDVAVIACYQFVTNLDSIQELWLKTGVGSNKRYIAIHTTCQTLGTTLSKLLPVFHAITGCDSVSAISGKGKKSAFTHLKENIGRFTDMQSFGETSTIDTTADYIETVIQFICELYDKQFKSANINALRFKLFTKKSLSDEKLPPTLDALLLHLRRSAYQCFIWKSACVPLLSLPQPVGNGWIEKNGQLSPEFMLLDSVPESVLELVQCKCKKGCKNNSCSCRKHKLTCCDACSCSIEEDCENTIYEIEDDSDSEYDDY